MASSFKSDLRLEEGGGGLIEILSFACFSGPSHSGSRASTQGKQTGLLNKSDLFLGFCVEKSFHDEMCDYKTRQTKEV